LESAPHKIRAGKAPNKNNKRRYEKNFRESRREIVFKRMFVLLSIGSDKIKIIAGKESGFKL
jgi:hypothetical protein